MDPDTVRDQVSFLVMLYGYGNILQAAAAMFDGAQLPDRIRLWDQTAARLAWAERQAAKLTADRPDTGPRPARPEACRCDGRGIIADDGTVTGLTGWPLPCPCTDTIPARVRALVQPRERMTRP
jgi:hypothetical protein